MSDSPLDPNEWYPSDLAAFAPENVWEMPERIVALTVAGDRLFVTLEGGQVVDMGRPDGSNTTRQ